MMTRRGTTADRVRITTVAVLSLFAFSVAIASAQAPPPVTCTTYPSGSPWQTIVVRPVDNDCKIDFETDVRLLRTYLTGRAYWDVCNQCGAPVDVKIYDSSPNHLSDLFSAFSPLIDASNTSTARNISPGQAGYFSGNVGGEGTPTGWNKYSVAVKLSTEGEGGWDEYDPELQIDDFQGNYLKWILAALVAGASLFGAGWWFGLRRAVSQK
jgi:hypothetical protein